MVKVMYLAAFSILAANAANASGLAYPDQGKILATGGVSEVEGAGGGGLTPWAVITGYGTADSFGVNAHYTFVHLTDQTLNTYGVAASAFDRVEFSYAKEKYRFRSGLLSTGGESSIDADVFGLKVKLLGDIVYDQDRWYPQVALGAMYKKNKGLDIPVLGVTDFSPTNLGAKHDSGIDYYLSATKLYLSQSILVNLTLRATKANQFGLLGFGGDRSDNYHLEPELSLAYLFTRKLAAGAEYRAKPHNLNIDSESGAYDFFIAYFPSTNVSVTAAYVDLGTIGKQVAAAFSSTDYGGRQRGPYISIQAGF
jgi:Protein of unknown function (DUF3034)